MQIKYWKAHKLIKQKFSNGFAFNRKHFHTKIDACISCISWKNIKDNETEFDLEAFNIVENKLYNEGKIPVKQINNTISKYYDKREFDDVTDGIATELNGIESKKEKVNVIKKYNPNIIGYIVANGTGFDNPDLNSALTIAGRYDGHGEFLRKDNFLEILPIFSAGRYIKYNRDWKARAMTMKSSDKLE